MRVKILIWDSQAEQIDRLGIGSEEDHKVFVDGYYDVFKTIAFWLDEDENIVVATESTGFTFKYDSLLWSALELVAAGWELTRRS